MTWLIIASLARQSAFGDFATLIEDPSERTYIPSSQTDYSGIIEGNPDYFFATSPLLNKFSFSVYGTPRNEYGAGFGYSMKNWTAGINSIYDSSGNYITAGVGFQNRWLRVDATFYIRDNAKALIRVLWKAFEQASINLIAQNITAKQAALSISFEPTSLTFFHMGIGYLQNDAYLFSMVEFPILKNFVFLRGSYQQNMSTLEKSINFGASLRFDNLSLDYVLKPSTGYNLDLQYHFKIF